MVKKKEKELKPEAIKSDNFDIEINKLKGLAKNIDKFDFDVNQNKEETFYKLAIEKLFDNDDKTVETKTEFLNPAEVFTATKLQFLGQYGDIPLLHNFITALERKRISLNRKGREEIIMALQERHQEEVEIKKSSVFGQGGVI